MKRIVWNEKDKNKAFSYICDCIELYGEPLRSLLLKKNSPFHPNNMTRELRKSLDEEPPKILPSLKTFYNWLEEDEKFVERYMRACDERAHTMFDDITDIARNSGSDKDSIAKARLEIDAYKWVIGKMKPTKYGDRLITEDAGEQYNSEKAAPTKIKILFKDFSGDDPE